MSLTHWNISLTSWHDSWAQWVVSWTSFDGNIDNLVQEMSKLGQETVQYHDVQETCLEAKEMCQGVNPVQPGLFQTAPPLDFRFWDFPWHCNLCCWISCIWAKSCRTGKKCFEWYNLTLTPRVALSKPFILQTWVFYLVGLLYPGHLHKNLQLPGTIFKGWKVSLKFWHLGVLG